MSRWRTPAPADLVHRHFLMQDERPGHLAGVEADSLDPLLRCLLFTEGTISGALAVQTLSQVHVDRISQTEVPLPADSAAHLEAEAGSTAVRRLVSICAGSAAAPVLMAESYLLPERLSPGFMAILDGAPDGIGQAMQRVSLESCRELLWLGLGAPPSWATGAVGEGVIQRLYRIVSDRQASILISESFAVERHEGVYRLARAAMPARSGPDRSR